MGDDKVSVPLSDSSSWAVTDRFLHLSPSGAAMGHSPAPYNDGDDEECADALPDEGAASAADLAFALRKCDNFVIFSCQAGRLVRAPVCLIGASSSRVSLDNRLGKASAESSARGPCELSLPVCVASLTCERVCVRVS